MIKKLIFFKFKRFYIFQIYLYNVHFGKNEIKIVEKIYIGTKTTFEFFSNKKILIFNVKYFIINRYKCKMYILADIN